MDQQQDEKHVRIRIRKTNVFCYLEAIVHRNRGYSYLSALRTVDGSSSKIRCRKTRENVRLLFVFSPSAFIFFPFLAVADSFLWNITDCGLWNGM
jgi:hypothetical protein